MSQEELISFNRVTIVGPGLLGAYIVMSLKKKGIAREIWVWYSIYGAESTGTGSQVIV